MPSATGLSERGRHARALFAGLPSSYDRMGALLSFGQDPRWRRFMVSRLPPLGAGARVLDVATGTGMVAREVVRATGASVVGVDLSEDMLRGGIRETETAGADRIRFMVGDGQRLPFPDGVFDALTFTYLLRYVDDVATTLAELARVVRPGGVVANLEFHVPKGPVWQPLWRLYTRVAMPGVGRLVSSAWYEVGRFLGPSISSFYDRWPLDRQLDAWRRAGVGDVHARVMSLGGGVVIWGTKRGRADD
jgi:demethylmenaquinone methyltransferase / 2-methoxy-6-polyprenyl-1,4-benzoquinol methylase